MNLQYACLYTVFFLISQKNVKEISNFFAILHHNCRKNKSKTMSYEKDYVSVFYNPKFMGVEVKWKDYANDVEYKQALNEAAKLAFSRKAQRWLSDMSQGRAISAEANNWVKSIFIPKLVRQGIKKAAFIVSNDVFRKMTANSLKTVVANYEVELQYFDNRILAETWLKR